MQNKWILWDTNVWIFGLRNIPEYPHCRRILLNLPKFRTSIPRQVLRELLENLDQQEMNRLFQLINFYSDRIAASWALADAKLIKKYQRAGCKKGDAVVAAHADALKVGVLITENRGFLRQCKRLPFVIMNSEGIFKNPWPVSKNITSSSTASQSPASRSNPSSILLMAA